MQKKSVVRHILMLGVSFWLGLVLLPQLAAQGPTPLLTMNEDQCLQILQSPSASLKDKVDACRQLAVIGSEKSIPILAQLLDDPQLSHMARYALEPNPSSQVDVVFRKALNRLTGRQLIGVIHSIGVRQDKAAVPQLIGILQHHKDDLVRNEAARALGRIGTRECAEALLELLQHPELNQDLRLAVCEGALRCAEHLATAGDLETARMIYDKVRTAPIVLPYQVRVGAWQGAIVTRGTVAAPLFREAVLGNDPQVAAGALQLLRGIQFPFVTQPAALQQQLLQATAELFGQLSPERQILAIQCLPSLADCGAADRILRTGLLSPNPDVQIAAINKTGELQPAWASSVLLALTQAAENRTATAAERVWIHLNDPAVDQCLLVRLHTAPSAALPRICELAVERRLTAAVPILLGLLERPDKPVRIAAIRALGELSTDKTITPLLRQLKQATDSDEIQALGQAMTRLLRASSRPEQFLPAFQSELATATPAQKEVLLNLLASIGTERALASVVNVFKTQTDAREPALRILTSWSSTSVIPHLWEVAEHPANPRERQLALTALLRHAQSSELPVPERLNICRRVLEFDRSADLSRRILAALGQIPHPEAIELITSFLKQEEVRQEALAAVRSCLERLQRTRLSKQQRDAVAQQLRSAAQMPELSQSDREQLQQLAAKISGQ